MTAETTIVTDNVTGVQRAGWKLGVRNVLLGLVRVQDLTLVLDPAGRRWTGTAGLFIASPTPLQARADWVIEDGTLRSATARLDSVRTPIAAGVLLRRLDLGMSRSPFELRGTLAVETAARVAGQVPIALDGNFLYRSVGVGNANNTLRVDGQMRFMGFPAANGHIQLWPAGTLDLGLQVAVGLPNVALAQPAQ